MSAKTITHHYTRLLTLWPTDALRRIPFSNVLSSRLSSQTPSTPSNLSSTPSSAPPSPPTPAPPASTLVEINALYSLVENRYAKTHPLSKAYLRPSGNEEYYERLMKELEEAPRLNWLQRWVRGWRGFLRWS